jgi:hypothetical protein
MKKSIKYFSIFISIFVFIVLLSFIFKSNTFANTCSSLGGSGGSGSICNFSPPIVSASCHFSGIASTVVNVLFTVAGLLFFVMIVISGIKMITAGDDKEKFSSAKATLTHAVLGIVIVIASYLILSIILGILGVNISIFSTSVSIGSCTL